MWNWSVHNRKITRKPNDATVIDRNYSTELLAARARGNFGGGILVLRRARRWDGAWSRSNGRFAGRTLGCRRRVLGACQFSALVQPGLIIGWAVDDDRALHSIMAKPAELTANNFVSPGLDWFEPHRNQ